MKLRTVLVRLEKIFDERGNVDVLIDSGRTVIDGHEVVSLMDDIESLKFDKRENSVVLNKR